MGQEVQPIKTSFNAGELSPRLAGRVDVSKYQFGCAILENFIVLAHGGFKRRPGSRFVQEVKDSTRKTRLLSFIFNEDQSYILEFGHQTLRFFTDGGILTETAKNITAATKANPVVITSAAHGFSNGDQVIIAGVVGMTQLNTGHPFTVANKTTDAFELQGINGTAYGTYVSGGTVARVYTVTTPYTEDDLSLLKDTQSADVAYLFHRSYAPRKLSRLGAANWTLTTPSFTGVTFNSANNYPGCGVFHEQRLIMAGTNAEPQAVWGSKINDYENYTIGTNDDDAFKYTIATDKVNQIRWLTSGKVLGCGTVGAEFSIGSTDLKESITPTNVRVLRETTHGSADVSPVQVESSVLFVQRARRKVREFVYDYQADGYIAPDVTILAEHILRKGDGLVDLAYQEEPDSNVWGVRKDGQCVTLTFQKAQEVAGWGRQILGGTDAVVESVAVIPSEDEDQVWLCVKRTINGVARRYIEYLTPTFYRSSTTDKEQAVFSDCSLTYEGTATNMVSGLEFLEGQTVQILADGRVRPDDVVTDGKVYLPAGSTAEIITVGLKCPCRIRTMNFDTGNPKGSAQGRLARITGCIVRVYETLGGKIGHSSLTDDEFESLEELYLDSGGIIMDESPDLFTGDLPFTRMPTGFTRDPHIEYLNDQPLPVTILAMMPTFQVNG
jgi:hypothetical protein